MTFFDAIGAAVDLTAACASAGLLALAGTIVVRDRGARPVRLGGRVVPHPRLVAGWTAATGLWGLLAAGRGAGLAWIGTLPIVALMLVSLGLLATLLSRTQHGDSAGVRPTGAGGARPGETVRTQAGEGIWGRPGETARARTATAAEALAGKAMRAGGRLRRRVSVYLRNGR